MNIETASLSTYVPFDDKEEEEKEPEILVAKMSDYKPNKRSVGRIAGDIGVTAAKATVGLGESAVGLMDYAPIGLMFGDTKTGHIGKALEDIGLDFDETQKFLHSLYSDPLKAKYEDIHKQKGFVNTAKEYFKNPEALAHTAGESLPQLFGAGGIGGAIRKVAPKIPGVVAGAMGEGALQAGSQIESFRSQNETGYATPGQTAIAAGSGLTTALIAALGGKAAEKMGIVDPETLATLGIKEMIAKGGPKGIARNIVGAPISEGLLQEAPQSFMEQVAENLGTGRPLLEGAPEAAGTGLATGGVVGLGAGVMGASTGRRQRRLAQKVEEEALIMEALKDKLKSPEAVLSTPTTNLEQATLEGIPQADQPVLVAKMSDYVPTPVIEQHVEGKGGKVLTQEQMNFEQKKVEEKKEEAIVEMGITPSKEGDVSAPSVEKINTGEKSIIDRMMEKGYTLEDLEELDKNGTFEETVRAVLMGEQSGVLELHNANAATQGNTDKFATKPGLLEPTETLYKDLPQTEKDSLKRFTDVLLNEGFKEEEIAEHTYGNLKKAAEHIVKMREVNKVIEEKIVAPSKMRVAKLGKKRKVVKTVEEEAASEVPLRDVAETLDEFANVDVANMTPEDFAAMTDLIAMELEELNDPDIDAATIHAMKVENMEKELQDKQTSPIDKAVRRKMLKERVEALAAKQDKEPKTRRKVATPAIEQTPEYYESILEQEGMGQEVGEKPEPLVDEYLDNIRDDNPYETDKGRRGLVFNMLGMQSVYELAVDTLRNNPTIDNLVRVGKGAMLEGYKSFGEFRARVKEIVGDTWDKVGHLIREAWETVKDWNAKVGEAGHIVFHGTGTMFNRFLDQFIGSGENGALRGHGHYFGSTWGLGKHYAELYVRLHGKEEGDYKVFYKGKPLSIDWFTAREMSTGNLQEQLDLLFNYAIDHCKSLGVTHEPSRNVLIPPGYFGDRYLRDVLSGFLSKDATFAGLPGRLKVARGLLANEILYVEKLKARVEKLKQHPSPDKPRAVAGRGSNPADYILSPNQEIAIRTRTIERKTSGIDSLNELFNMVEENPQLYNELMPIPLGKMSLIKVYKELRDFGGINSLGLDFERPKKPPKVIHTVELPDDIKLLDLDKPLSAEQAGELFEALTSLAETGTIYTAERVDTYGRILHGTYHIIMRELAAVRDGAVINPIGEVAAEDIRSPYTRDDGRYDNKSREILIPKGKTITEEDLKLLKEIGIERVPIQDKLDFENVVSWVGINNFDGERLQQELWGLFSAPGKELQGLETSEAKRRTSEFLRDELGYNGNTYIGDNSGRRCYVIFDEDIPKIVSSTTLDFLGLQSLYERIENKINNIKANRALLERVRALPGTKAEDTVTEKPTDTILHDKRPTEKDISDWRKWQPSLYVYDGTVGEKHAYGVVMAESSMESAIARNTEEIKKAIAGLSQEERENLRSTLEGKPAMSRNVEVAAAKIRIWLDVMAERYMAYMRKEYEKHLTPDEYEAVMDLVNKKDLQATFIKWRGKVDPDLLSELYTDYINIKRWKLDNYVPNVELGKYIIVDSKGHIKAVGMSTLDAARKAIAYKEAHPEVGELFLDVNKHIDQETKTGISVKGYYAVMGRLSKAINSRVEGLNKQIASGMAKRAVKGVFTIKPTAAFSEFSLSRRDVLLGEKDIIPVLFKYSRRMEKKMALDPVIHEIHKDMSNLDKYPNIKKGILAMVEDAKGQYGAADKLIDEAINMITRKIGEKFHTEIPEVSFALTRATGAARTAVANLIFAYRPIAGLINGLGGVMHIWYKTSAKLMTDAIAFGKTPEGKELVRQWSDYFGTAITYTEAGTPHVRRPIWHPTGLFQYPEVPVRSLGFLTNYLLAKKTFGYDEDAAITFALKANAMQQTFYNAANLPYAMRGPVGRTIGQFKPWLINEMSLIKNLTGAEWGKYMLGTLLVTGPKGILMIMKSLPFLFALGLLGKGDDVLEWMNKEMPRLSRGIGGLLGVDITAPATFQFPTSMSEIFGPTLSSTWKFIDLWMQKAKGVAVDRKDVGKALIGLSPSARNMKEVVDTLFYNDGTIRNDRGEVMYNVYDISTPQGEKAMRIAGYTTAKVMGATPLAIDLPRSTDQILRRREEVDTKNRLKIVDRMTESIRLGREIDPEVWDAFIEMGMTVDTLTRSMKWKELSPRMRATLRSQVRDRLHILETYPESIESPLEATQ